jgi:hypothetical protein
MFSVYFHQPHPHSHCQPHRPAKNGKNTILHIAPLKIMISAREIRQKTRLFHKSQALHTDFKFSENTNLLYYLNYTDDFISALTDILQGK